LLKELNSRRDEGQLSVLLFGVVVKKKALALTLMMFLLSSAVAIKMVSLAEANPDWAYTGANWKYVTTITGTSDQKTTVLVPNQAHLSISGNCTTGSGESLFGIFFGSGGYEHPYSSVGLHSVGFTSFSSSRGPANVSLVIQTKNVLSYTLEVEYDAAAPLTRSTPSLAPSTSPSPSPSSLPTASPSSLNQEEKTESLPTTLFIASIVSVAVVGLGLLLYFKKHKQ
jgi:hypothetical protein